MPRLPRSALQRQAIARHKMNPGSGGGVHAVVAPVKTVPAPAKVTVVPEEVNFSVIGDMEVRTSGKYTVQRGGRITVVTSATAAGTGDTEFDILLNGSAVGSGVVYPDTETDPQTDVLPGRAQPGNTLQIDFTVAGMHENLNALVVLEP